MADRQDETVGGALDHLVNQFSDPLSFLRELVQNSLDAGSREVEVWVEHQPGDGEEGTLIIHVDDFGEGMDRAIIDTRLTRLFSSAKDDDLTKIGRFGIGFASVFALEPEAVCVDTSRGGESWRVLFREDRSFSRIERDDPVEGTKIQVIKSATAAEAEALRQRARQVLTYWCKHVEGELRFDGERIDTPLDVEAPIKVSREADGTRIVAGFTTAGSSFCGFYNKGLTLLETTGGPDAYSRVAYKVSSRYLEHTLTRDNVLHDRQYDKAMALVAELVEEGLVEELSVTLDRVVRDRTRGDGELRLLQDLLAWHLTGGLPAPPPEAEERAVARTPSGAALTLGACRRAAAKGRLLVAHADSPLVSALEEAGQVVVADDSGHRALVAALTGEVPTPVGEAYCLPLPVETEVAKRFAPLRRGIEALLRAARAKVRAVELGRLFYPGSNAGVWYAISQRELGELTPTSEARELGLKLLSRRRVLVVNVDHPTVESLAELALTEPELAAYVLAKLFFLARQLDAPLQDALLEKSVEGRCRRLTG